VSLFQRKEPRPQHGAQRSVGSEPASPAPGVTFLGTLRSEFDEPEHLPDGFQRLYDNVEELILAFKEGRLTRVALAERLRKQVARDGNGAEWTIGARTMTWYRRQGPSRWLPVPAPSQTIGEPVPGSWSQPLELPVGPVTTAPAPAAAAAVLPSPQEVVPEPTTADPTTQVAGPAPETPATPCTYQETFDAGLAALLASTNRDEAEVGDSRDEEFTPTRRYGAGYWDDSPPAAREEVPVTLSVDSPAESAPTGAGPWYDPFLVGDQHHESLLESDGYLAAEQTTDDPEAPGDDTPWNPEDLFK
jgi:hypothetical protein